MMPEMDGWEVCRRLKADPATASIPVIYVTALASDADRERASSLSAVGFVTKPLEPEVIRELVRALIS